MDSPASASQTPCSAGTWQNQSGQPSCMDADPGYYAGYECVHHPDSLLCGTLLGAGNVYRRFFWGHYVPNNASTSQTPADPGHYVEANASASQTPCSAGTWQNRTPGYRGYEYVHHPDSLLCWDLPAFLAGQGNVYRRFFGEHTSRTAMLPPHRLSRPRGHYVDNDLHSQTPCSTGTWQTSPTLVHRGPRILRG